MKRIKTYHLPDWQKISLEKPVLEISDTDIEENIKDIAKNIATYDKESKGKAKKKDKVILNLEVTINGDAKPTKKLEKHEIIIGSNKYKALEDKLIDVKAGEKHQFKLKLDENFLNKEFKDKEALFNVEINSIFKISEAKIDDDFAKKLQCDNLSDLREKIKKDINYTYSHSIKTLMKKSLFDNLENIIKFEVPEKLLNQEIENIKREADNIKNEEKEGKSKSKKELENYYKQLAMRRVRIGLLLSEYAKVESIKIDKQDIQKAIQEQARNYPGMEDKIFEIYSKNPQAVDLIKGPILEEKAVTHIFDNKISTTERKYRKEDLKRMIEEVL